MYKVKREICIALICLIIFGMLTGCVQKEKSEPQQSKEPNQEAIVPSSPQKENIIKPNEGESVSGSTDNNNIQKEEPTDLQFNFYPSGRDFIQSH